MSNHVIKKNFTIDILINILLFLIFSFLFIKNYSGNNKSIESFMFDKYSGLSNYQYDFFLNNALHDKISIIYKIIGLFNINLSNDNIGFLVYFSFSTLSLLYTYKIIKKFIINLSLNEIILILLVLGYSTSLFLEANKTSWITGHNNVQTFFVMCLKPIFLWHLLNKKTFGLAILSSLMLLIGLKSSWFIIGFAGLYTLIFFRNNLIWIFLPLITLIYIISLSPDFDSSEKAFLFQNLLARDKEEGDFAQQNYLNLSILIFSFFINFFIIKKIKAKYEFKNFLKLLLYLSITTFIIFFLYSKYGLYIFAEPRILSLGSPRALELYEFFFMITLLVYIFQINLKYIYKIIFLIIILNLLTKSILAISSSLILSLIVLIIVKNEIKINFDLKNKSICIIFFLFSLIPGIFYLLYSKFDNTISFYSYKEINKLVVGKIKHDPQRIENLIYLRKCNDFILIDLEYGLISNLISLKSSFNQGTHSNYFNKEVILESKKRYNIIQEIKQNLNKENKINQYTFSDYFNYDIFIILDKDKVEYFSKNLNYFRLKNDETLIQVSNKNSFTDLCKIKY